MNIKLMTIEELIEYIVGRLDLKNVKRRKFPECDFAFPCPSDRFNEDLKDDLETCAMNADDWFGIKEISAGFDNDCGIYIMSEYYGGGNPAFVYIEDGDSDVFVKQKIEKMLLDSIWIRANLESEWLNTNLIVEFLEE